MTEEVSVIEPGHRSCSRTAASARSRSKARRWRTSPATDACCSTSRRWCRASLSRNAAGTEIAVGRRLHRERPAPESNNITIDGVANIDTGNNGGNMVTTNIDSVAEFKILTNSYQAEYGRAVGGQMQVVTKSGTQNFHGSGLLVRTSFGLGRQHLAEQPQHAGDPEARHVAQRLRLHHRRAGGLSGFQRRARRSCSSSGARSFSDARTRRRCTRRTVPTALERQGDFSQSVDSSGNPFPYIRDSTTGLPCGAGNTTRMFPGRRRARPDSGEPPLCARPCRAEHLSRCELLRRQRLELHEPGARPVAAARRSAADGLPGRQQLADHRPLHEEQGRHHAGVRDDVGRQRQRPASDAGAVPAPRLRTTCCRRRAP